MAGRGKFVTLEGGEASGKSTQAARLAEALGAVLSREPGGTALGEAVRRLVLDPELERISPRTELLLLAAARAEHVARVIGPALEGGRDVVCDRFDGSTLAYQGYGRGLPLEQVAAASHLATAGREPDLRVLLDLPPQLAASRREGRPDRIEAEEPEFHERVAKGFRALAAADPAHWVVVDGSGSVEVVAEAVRSAVEGRLSSRPAGARR